MLKLELYADHSADLSSVYQNISYYCVSSINRWPWFTRIRNSTSRHTPTYRIFWMHLWCGTANKSNHSRFTQNTTPYGKISGSVWDQWMLKLYVSAWRCLLAIWFHIFVSRKLELGWNFFLVVVFYSYNRFFRNKNMRNNWKYSNFLIFFCGTSLFQV